RVPLSGALHHLQLAAPGGPVVVPDEDAGALLTVALVADRRGRLLVVDTAGNRLRIFTATPQLRQVDAIPPPRRQYGITYDRTGDRLWGPSRCCWWRVPGLLGERTAAGPRGTSATRLYRGGRYTAHPGGFAQRVHCGLAGDGDVRRGGLAAGLR